jgi:uncharacterized hydrophobic protein (TIGR00341 family)
MQIIEIHLAAGEASRGVSILKELGIEDYSVISSGSGDQITVRHPLDKTDTIVSRFQEEFKFGKDENRGIVLLKPDVILPNEPEKEKKGQEISAKECLVEYAEQNAYLDSKYLALFFFSAVVATLGLITENIAVVVGAMIIAPAFGPISSMAIGVVINRHDLLKEGMKSEMAGVGIAIFTAAIIGILIPGIEVNSSLQLRMMPGLFDLLIGLAAGAAGGYVLVSGRGPNIVGVMIAAALLPVMVSIGLSFVFLNPFFVFGSILLLGITVLSIVLSMVMVFWLVGPQREHIHLAHEYHLTQDAIRRFVRYVAVVIVILAIPLTWLTYEDMVTDQPAKEITKLFETKKYADLELESVEIEGREIMVKLYNFGTITESELEAIGGEISKLVDSRYRVAFNIVSAQKRSY